jgi:chloramphenicol 3-O-phosphotransferase
MNAAEVPISPERILVILTGPVGGGKSTTALALAERFRACRQTAAVIDLDVVYCMARQVDGFGEMNIWATARHAAAALADAFFRDGLHIVIVEGEFFSQDELDALCAYLTTPVECHFVTLAVSLEQALHRVAGDPSRGLSRDPDFLAWLHAQFVQALPFLRASSLVVDADQRAPSELAEAISQAIQCHVA